MALELDCPLPRKSFCMDDNNRAKRWRKIDNKKSRKREEWQKAKTLQKLYCTNKSGSHPRPDLLQSVRHSVWNGPKMSSLTILWFFMGITRKWMKSYNFSLFLALLHQQWWDDDFICHIRTIHPLKFPLLIWQQKHCIDIDFSRLYCTFFSHFEAPGFIQ